MKNQIAFFTAFLFCAPMLLPCRMEAQFFTPEIRDCITTGELNDAAELLGTYIRQNPDSLNAYLLLARVHMGIGGPNPHSAAERALREAVKRFGEDAGILKMLAEVKTLQDQPARAAEWMELAIQTDPDDNDLLGELVDSYLKRRDREMAFKLEPMVRAAIENRPERLINYISLGRLCMAQKKYAEALTVLEEGKHIDPLNPKLLGVLAEAYLWNGRGAEFTGAYYAWLGLEHELSELEREYAIMSMTMPFETYEEFRTIPWVERRSYLLKYWRSQDPYAHTELNERLMEHCRRIYYSMDAYRTAIGKLGFDDRGKVYIKLGEPEDKISFSGEESWYYPSYGLYMAFDFSDHGGYYQEDYAPPIGNFGVDPASAGKSGTDDALRDPLLGWFRLRMPLGGIYSIMANQSPTGIAQRVLNEYIPNRVRATWHEKPRYELALDMPKLKYDFRTAQFRGDSGGTALEIAYGIPLDQFDIPRDSVMVAPLNVLMDCVLLDSVYERSQRGQRAFSGRPDSSLTAYGRLVDGDRETVSPGDYTLSLQLLEMSMRRGNFSSSALRIRDFSPKELLVSDLKFSRKAQGRGRDERRNMELIETEPYPFSFVKKSEPVFLYFEIYNLTLDPNAKSDYRVSLLVERRRTTGEYFALPIASIGSIFTDGKPRRIETVYNRQGDSQTGVEYLRLDVAGLESGRSRLTVTVEDQNARGAARSSIEFDLIE